MACDAGVRTYNRTPFRGMNRCIGPFHLKHGLRHRGTCVAPRGTASAVLKCFRRFPGLPLFFPRAMTASKQCYNKTHLRWQPVRTRPSNNPQVLGVPSPPQCCQPLTLAHCITHVMPNTKTNLQSHNQSQRVGCPEGLRHARHTQGACKTPVTHRTLEPPPKSGSTLEKLKIGQTRLDHCDRHPRKPQCSHFTSRMSRAPLELLSCTQNRPFE